MEVILVIIADGWAKSDVEYVWKENPVQLAGNLSLPGGFKLGAFGSEYCDVVTATGRQDGAISKSSLDRDTQYRLLSKWDLY